MAFSTSGQVISEKPEDTARRFTRAYEFDYFDWTMNAVVVKLGQSAIDTPYYFDETDRHDAVQKYLLVLDYILQDEYKLNLIYTDPTITDPVTASAYLRARLEELYARQRQLAPMAEAVLQAQTSATLADLRLTTGGQPIPPVAFHISPLPYHLIISPRDRIQQDAWLLPVMPAILYDYRYRVRKHKSLHVRLHLTRQNGRSIPPRRRRESTALATRMARRVYHGQAAYAWYRLNMTGISAHLARMWYGHIYSATHIPLLRRLELFNSSSLILCTKLAAVVFLLQQLV